MDDLVENTEISQNTVNDILQTQINFKKGIRAIYLQNQFPCQFCL